MRWMNCKSKSCYQTFTLDICCVCINALSWYTLITYSIVEKCVVNIVCVWIEIHFRIILLPRAWLGKSTMDAEQDHKYAHTHTYSLIPISVHSLSFVRSFQFKLYCMLNINFYMHLKWACVWLNEHHKNRLRPLGQFECIHVRWFLWNVHFIVAQAFVIIPCQFQKTWKSRVKAHSYIFTVEISVGCNVKS